MNRLYLLGTAAAVCAVTVMNPLCAEASDNYSMRRKLLITAGILEAGEENAPVTRGEFAKMLVKASAFKDVAEEVNVTIYPDVPMDHPFAAYIRIAAEQGWMTAFLGGSFKPDEQVRMVDAVRAVMTLLGYTDEDFAGNLIGNRMAKFTALGMNEEIAKSSTDTLVKSDCVHLLYSLLNTNTKSNEGKTKTSSTIYGAFLGYSLTSDGDLNPLSALETKLKGPYVLQSGEKLGSIITFSKSKASYYLDGEPSTKSEIEGAAEDGVVVVYYNADVKMVYAYSESGSADEDGNSKIGAAEGKLEAIYYGSADVMIPTSIMLDGEEYLIQSSDMQYAFSVYGSVEVKDKITIVWEMQTVNGEDRMVVIDYID